MLRRLEAGVRRRPLSAAATLLLALVSPCLPLQIVGELAGVAYTVQPSTTVETRSSR